MEHFRPIIIPTHTLHQDPELGHLILVYTALEGVHQIRDRDTLRGDAGADFRRRDLEGGWGRGCTLQMIEVSGFVKKEKTTWHGFERKLWGGGLGGTHEGLRLYHRQQHWL